MVTRLLGDLYCINYTAATAKFKIFCYSYIFFLLNVPRKPNRNIQYWLGCLPNKLKLLFPSLHGGRIKSFWYSHNGSCLEMCLGVEFKLECVYTPRFNLKHIQWNTTRPGETNVWLPFLCGLVWYLCLSGFKGFSWSWI